MRKIVPIELIHGRIRTGPLASVGSDGMNGAFRVKLGKRLLCMIVNDGLGWDHVSVHVEENGKQRTPTWDEMRWAKHLCFEEHEIAMQLHPASSDYVNFHPCTLHIWRPQEEWIPLPPIRMV